MPVLMLTARGEENDRITGLEGGADDYLPKPFNPREMVARIRSILRRAIARDAAPAPSPPVSEIFIGDMRMDMVGRALYRGDREIRLTGIEFKILEKLVAAGGRVIDRETLYASVFEREYSPLDRSLDVHISNLRRKIQEKKENAQLIKTIRGEGYVFAGTVKPS